MQREFDKTSYTSGVQHMIGTLSIIYTIASKFANHIGSPCKINVSKKDNDIQNNQTELKIKFKI